MTIISQKQTLVTVNSLKVVDIALLEIWKLYQAHAPLHTRMVSPIEYLFCFNPVQANVPFMEKPGSSFAFWIFSLKQQPTTFISYKPRESGDIDFSSGHVSGFRCLLDQKIMFGSLVH